MRDGGELPADDMTPCRPGRAPKTRDWGSTEERAAAEGGSQPILAGCFPSHHAVSFLFSPSPCDPNAIPNRHIDARQAPAAGLTPARPLIRHATTGHAQPLRVQKESEIEA